MNTDYDHIIRTYMASPEGRDKLVQSMKQPLALRTAYMGLWSRVFLPSPELKEEAESHHTVNIRTRFPTEHTRDAFDQVLLELTGSVNLHLDRLALGLGRAYSDPEDFPGWGSLPPIHEGRLCMNARDYGDMRNDPVVREEQNIVTNREILSNGLMSDFRGSTVITDKLIEPGIIYHYGAPGNVARWWSELEMSLDGDFIHTKVHYVLDPVEDPQVTVYVR